MSSRWWASPWKCRITEQGGGHRGVLRRRGPDWLRLPGRRRRTAASAGTLLTASARIITYGGDRLRSAVGRALIQSTNPKSMIYDGTTLQGAFTADSVDWNSTGWMCRPASEKVWRTLISGHWKRSLRLLLFQCLSDWNPGTIVALSLI